MSYIKPTQLSFYIFTLALVMFLLVGFCGAFFSFGMEMDGHEMMGCPFMGEAAICTMTVFEHLSIWQNIFAAIPQNVGNWITLLLALAILLPIIMFNRYRASVFYNLQHVIDRFRMSQLFDSIRNYLGFAFSQGILHSKAH